MRKKILLGMGAFVAVAVGVAGLSAFEAHVINVTAKIENALQVPSEAINFGTVFPQEELERPLQLTLSESFLDEPDADDVDYIIRQKPKCAVTNEDGTEIISPTWTGHVVPVGEDDFEVDCEQDRPDNVPESPTGEIDFYLLPSLCEYISKDGGDPDGLVEENDETTPSFHRPWEVVGGVIQWLDTNGRMAKSDEDTEDTWIIDLAVPCFGDHCAQDWEDFVREHGGEEALPADQWVQPIENESKVFGCNLWIEVTNVSRFGEPTPPPATVTVIKEVINDDGGTAVVADFSLFVDATAVVSGAANVFGTGAHVVSEADAAGYTSVISGDCDADGNVTLEPGDNKTCTITNDDIPPIEASDE